MSLSVSVRHQAVNVYKAVVQIVTTAGITGGVDRCSGSSKTFYLWMIISKSTCKRGRKVKTESAVDTSTVFFGSLSQNSSHTVRTEVRLKRLCGEYTSHFNIQHGDVFTYCCTVVRTNVPLDGDATG